MEVLLFLAHWFIYRTWVVFCGGLYPDAPLALRTIVFVLAFSFVSAALLSFRFSNFVVRVFYKLAALWLGFLNFLFLAACLCWMVWYAARVARLHPNAASFRPVVAAALFALALVASLYGIVNALWIRLRRVAIQIPALPASWRGRRAVLFSDLHLGNINGAEFCRRVVAMAVRLNPDIVFLPGDLFDGTKADFDRLAAPLKKLAPPLGIFFSTGNHEEFGGAAHCEEAIARAGVRVLHNQLVTVDGVAIAGVPYSDSTYPIRMKATLEGMRLDRARPGILLNHAPMRLPIVEQSGFALQLSGHTHGGQMFPFTWITRRAFGKFTYGLQRFGALQVYTSSGAGTWGPPMRVGTHPEIVLITFE